MSSSDVFDEKLDTRKLMDLPFKQLKLKCKQLKIIGSLPRTKQDACLRIYKKFLVDIRETDIFAKYESTRTEYAKAFLVKNIKLLTEQVRLNLTDRIRSNNARIKWIKAGFNFSTEATNSIIESVVWDARMHLVLLDQIEKEISVVEPCESKMIENEHHVCRICYDRYNESNSRMQILNDCGHVYCAKCVSQMDECPICRCVKKKVTTLFL
jgi:hypothetical protein